MELVHQSVPSRPTDRSACRPSSFVCTRLALLLLVVFAVLPRAFAKVHPVPLDKNADVSTCLQCHNSDDSRESGGAGPSGPHGSVYQHILERRYEFSTVAPGTNFPLNGPGSPIQNTFINPSLVGGNTNPGPYALCAKCHDLTNLLQDTSFKPGPTGKGGHFTHISEQGASCSVCHTAHGMGSLSPSVTGERMVNFDLNVVAPNTTSPISYNHTTNTCVLACHGYYHNSDGTVVVIPPPGAAPAQKIH